MDTTRGSGFNARKNRNSILQTAGDALGIRLNKRKRYSRPPTVVDDLVLEISANKNLDYDWTAVSQPIDEEAERERLRSAAAQAVGLSHPRPSVEEDPSTHGTRIKPNRTLHDNQPLPKYPSSLSALQNYVQASSNLLKYYPAPSPFLILSRSRQWKSRYLILTTHGGTDSHLHLFKANSPEDKELERLSLHQDSVVYVADEEVGSGRQYILKVGGKVIDSTAMKKEDAPPAIWLLQMQDSDQMERWIHFIKSSMLGQSLYTGSGSDVKNGLDVVLSLGRPGLLAPPKSGTVGSSGTSSPHSGLQNNGDEKGGTSGGLGPVSALKGFWNGRPTSRNLSISGSSIATALASPSSHSQTSAHIAQENTEPASQDGSSAKTRESTVFQMLRSTSCHITQPSKTHISPPTSPASISSLSDDGTAAASTPLGRRFPSSATPRPGHTHNSFSVDWDAIEGATLVGMGPGRMKSPTNQTALAPPPRRKLPIGGGRQGSPVKDLADERRPTPSPDMRRSLDDEGEIGMGTTIDLKPPPSDQEDGRDEEGDVQTSTGPHDHSPLSTVSYGQEDVGSQRSANVPSPMIHTPSLPPSSVSSFGANAGVKTAAHEQPTTSGISRSSTPSLHSESRDDQYIEEDHRSTEYDPESVNQFHLPTGARHRSRLGSFPKQPPSGPPPPPPPPIFHSPPFGAHSSNNDHSSSERPNSSSSIPSTVPSLHVGLPSLVNKRLSMMSTSDAPSIKSNESSTGSFGNSRNIGGSPFGNHRLAPSGSRGATLGPPRPPPAIPLPPAPLDDTSSMGGNPRNSISSKLEHGAPSSDTSSPSRSELTSRGIRHSVSPGPPPTAPLPPRPDTIPMSYHHQRSSVSSNGHVPLQSLFAIPGSPDRHITGSNLPAMAPLPTLPLPPTPYVGDAERSVSPSLSVSSNRSARSNSGIPFGRVSSLRARFRMSSSPTPTSIDSKKVIPPPQPPPNHPPPAPPLSDKPSSPTGWGPIGHQKQQLSNSTTDHSQFSSHSPPITPIGEAITSRLENYPFSTGLPSPSSTIPTFSTLASKALRPHAPQSEMTPLSPPPRRNSRASKDFSLQETERLRMLATLEEADKSSPYNSSAPAKHSAINLPGT